MNTVKYMMLITALACNVSATRFYADPENGSMDNDGSEGAPWSTFEDVWNDGKIESFYGARPFTVGDTLSTTRNEGAPVTGGDTLMLLSGYHGDINGPYGYYNKEFITIMRAPGHRPTMGQFSINSCSRWRLEGLVVSPSFLPDWSLDSNDYGICIAMGDHGYNGGSYLNEVIACTVFTEWIATAWDTVNWWQDAAGGIKLTDKGYIGYCHLKNVAGGPYVGGDSSLYEYNLVENFPTDGMRMAGTANVFQYNIIKNCINCSDNHDDAIQCYPSSYNGVLRGNVVIEFDFANNDWGATDTAARPFSGPLQGLFGGPWYNGLIENNLVIVDHWHGITMSSGDSTSNSLINNTVIDLVPGNPRVPWCMISGNGENHMVLNNVGQSISMASDSTGTKAGNHTMASYDEVYDLFTDPDNMDFSLKEGSALIDSGVDIAGVPRFDINGTVRPQGDGIDIGAFEYAVSHVGHTPVPVTAQGFLMPNPLTWAQLRLMPGITVMTLDGTEISGSRGNGLYLVREQGGAVSRVLVRD